MEKPVFTKLRAVLMISLRQRAMQALCLFAFLLVPQFLLAQTVIRPALGDGTKENPYQITSAEELAWYRDEVNANDNKACAILMDNIDMSSVCHAASDGKEGLSWNPISPEGVEWGGTFDGNGKTISNLYININSTNSWFAGLFELITNGIIKNLTFENAQVHVECGVGILVGAATKSKILNIKTDALSSISTSNPNINTCVGGIVGSANGCQIENCENRAKVSSSYMAGGICGDTGSCKIRGCSNHGQVSGTDYVGGISGCVVLTQGEGIIEDCANYAKVQGSYCVGGLVGCFRNSGELKNSFTCGDVVAENFGGILMGMKDDGSISGLVVYDTGATLNGYTNSSLIGDGKGDLDLIRGFSNNSLRQGIAAVLLQQNAAEGVTWGQNLEEDDYPVLGSSYKVYAEGDVIYDCSGDNVYAYLTNSFSEEAETGSFKMIHPGYLMHYEGVAATCLEDGEAECYKCAYCGRFFKDEALTNEIPGVEIAATGHDYYGESDTCTKCGLVIPDLKLGENKIQISRAFGNKGSINTYSSIFKFVATRDGTFEASASPSRSFYFTVWDGSKSKELNSSCCYSNANNTMTFNITKGETYYMGVRRSDGNAVDEEQTVTLKVNGMTEDLPVGTGAKESPYELYNASDLAWFRDQVNAGNDTACAKLMADIDMSSVCHEANESEGKEELSWEPISTKDIVWSGAFDGNGKTISNLYYYDMGIKNSCGGLFGKIEGTIKNVSLENAHVMLSGEESYGGILAAQTLFGSYIENIQTDARCSIDGYYVGGIIGFVYNGQIVNCINRAAVKGIEQIGGICGYILSDSIPTIKDCINYGNILGKASGGIAGIVGQFWGKTIENCANYGIISGDPYHEYSIAGGIVGNCSGNMVENCANYASVEASMAGGIVGYDNGGNGHVVFKNVFSKGDVFGKMYGGLVFGATIPTNTQAMGLVAYNSEATLRVGDKLKDPNSALNDGDQLASGQECLVSFTEDEIASGKVTYLLNNGVTDGTQIWYQKLGKDGDDYPVLTSTENNTVYRMDGYLCDGTLNEEFTPTYNNEGITRYDEPHSYQEKQLLQGLYAMTCSKCDAYESDKRTIKNFAGEGKNLEVTDVDGTCHVEQLTLTDAEPYYSPVELKVEEMNYERNFSGMAGKWQTLYVPFSFDCYDLKEEYEVAAINNFHEFEQKNGDTKVVLEVRKLTCGTLQPLTPYLIRLKEGASEPLSLSVFKENNKKLTLVPSESRYTDCASVTRYYKFTGVLQAKEGFVEDQDFVMNGGMLYKAAADARLNPQRWYLSATDRSGNSSSVEQLVRLRSISVKVVDEGTTTGIEDIYVTTDIEGVQSSRHGIYDLQGRKLSQEPTSGVYIKDGKKYVK